MGQGMVQYGLLDRHPGRPWFSLKLNCRSTKCYKSFDCRKLFKLLSLSFGIDLFVPFLFLLVFSFRFVSKLWDSFDSPAGCGKRIPRRAKLMSDVSSGAKTPVNQKGDAAPLCIATQSQTTPKENPGENPGDTLRHQYLFTIHNLYVAYMRHMYTFGMIQLKIFVSSTLLCFLSRICL